MQVSHPTFYVVMWLGYILGVSLLTLRIYTQKTRTTKAFDLSTTFISIGILGQSFNAAIATYFVSEARDNPLLIQHPIAYAKVGWAKMFLYYFNIYILKASFLALYYRVFLSGRAARGTRQGAAAPWIRPFLISVMVFCAASFLATELMNTFICFPVSRNWSVLDYCSPIFNREVFISSTVLNISSDLLIICFPLSAFYTLQLRTRADRTGFIFIIFLGSISILSALARFLLFWFSTLRHIPASAQNDGTEVLYAVPANTIMLTLWCSVEVTFGTIAACLPAFRAWWSWLLERGRMRSGGKYSSERSGESGGCRGIGQSAGSGTEVEFVEEEEMALYVAGRGINRVK